jgi:hypothetical protein
MPAGGGSYVKERVVTSESELKSRHKIAPYP